MARAHPVQLFRVIRFGAVLPGEELAVRGKGQGKRVAQARREQIALRLQRRLVIRQHDLRGVGRNPEDFGRERHLAELRKAPPLGLDLPVVRA
jgi:hypothetical protein